MILGLTKTMHTRIIGQPRIGRNAQQKKVEGFTYSFTTNIKRTDLDWNEIEDVSNKVFTDVFHIHSVEFVKDCEISLDIPSGQYSLRFTSSRELTEDAYAANINWYIKAYDGTEYFISDSKPLDYLANQRYDVTIELEPLSIAEVEETEKGGLI